MVSCTLGQAKAFAIAPKSTALASLLGSSYIAFTVLRSRRRRSRVHQRLLMSMSLCDAAASTAYFLTTWPMPRGTPGVWGAAGNVATCTAQGFFTQWGMCVAGYNACLSVFYCLTVVRRDYSAVAMRRTTERAMHALALGWPVLGAIVTAVDGAINPGDGSSCWIESDPPGCAGDECTRGRRADLYRTIFAIGPIMICLVVATVAWVMMCVAVRRRERKAIFESEERTAATLRRLITRQATLYLGAFYLTWSVPLAVQAYVGATGGRMLFPLELAQSMMLPMQGLLNVIVYFRPLKIACLEWIGTACCQSRCGGCRKRGNVEMDKEKNARQNASSAADAEDRCCGTDAPVIQQQHLVEDYIDDLSEALEQHSPNKKSSHQPRKASSSTDETPYCSTDHRREFDLTSASLSGSGLEGRDSFQEDGDNEEDVPV